MGHNRSRVHLSTKETQIFYHNKLIDGVELPEFPIEVFGLEHCRSSILPLRFEAGRDASKVHDQMLISVTLIFIAMSLILQLSTRVQL